MLKRIITGACYVVVMVLFFLIRELVEYRLFNILIAFMCAVGTFEVARAVKNLSVKNLFLTACVYGGLFPVIYCVSEYLLFSGFGWLCGVIYITLGVILATVLYFMDKKAENKSLFFTILPFLYPSVFILFMFLANDMLEGFTVLLLSFVISPLSDTFAYFVGSLLKGPKMCPKLSPKKTWSGAIGGTVGGIVGALIVWLIFPIQTSFIPSILVFIIAGILGSVINIFGDLFESFIKRRVGIKDMGKILPGHGGVMDRIDGTSFVIVIVYLLFLIF